MAESDYQKYLPWKFGIPCQSVEDLVRRTVFSPHAETNSLIVLADYRKREQVLREIMDVLKGLNISFVCSHANGKVSIPKGNVIVSADVIERCMGLRTKYFYYAD